MPKRSRELSIEIKEVDEDNNGVFEWNGKNYVTFLDRFMVDLLTNPYVNCDIIHNSNNQAMLNIECIRTGKILLCQEINPEKYRDSDEWMPDE